MNMLHKKNTAEYLWKWRIKRKLFNRNQSANASGCHQIAAA